MQTSTSLNLFRRRVRARAGLGGSQVTAYESWSTAWVDKVRLGLPTRVKTSERLSRQE
jgi:hypothetical protein